MGPAVARVGDTFVGYCNGPGHIANRECVGVWNTGSPTTSADGSPVVRNGDTGVTDCGHVVIAVSNSAIASADGVGLHRVGDTGLTEGGGVVVTVTGSPTTFSE